jgi:NTE family protein
MEATTGFEPVDGGFADLCLTTWLRRRDADSSILAQGCQSLDPGHSSCYDTCKRRLFDLLNFLSPHIGADVGLCVLSCYNGVAEKGNTPMIAFVLSGGGNRGALQGGAMKALLERGIYPDLIVATSVGALNGVTLAADPTVAGARRLAASWPLIRRADIFPGNPLTVGWRILRGHGSLHGQENLARFISRQVPPDVRRFKDLKVPCVVTATSLSTGQLRLFGSDPSERLLDALLASTAIPPFFSPYRYKDELLVDGALVANLPISQAIMRGARTIYTLEIVDELSAGAAPGMLGTLASSVNAMLSRQHEQERQITALGRKRGVVIHDIRLTSGQNLVYNDFSHSAELVDAGERATLAYLNEHPVPRASALTRMFTQAARGVADPSRWSLLRPPLALPALLALLKALPAHAEEHTPTGVA